MRIPIDKTGGYFDLRNVYAFFRAAADGSYMLHITRQRRGRTLDRVLTGSGARSILSFWTDCSTPGWEFTCVEQVHEFFKQLMAHEQVVNYDTGEVVEIPKSTATMDTQQFAAYVGRLREYARDT